MAKFRIKEIPLQFKIIILLAIVVLYIFSAIFIYSSSRNKISTSRAFLTDIYLKKNNLVSNTQRILNAFIVFNHISYEKLDDFINIQNSFFQTTDSIEYYIKQYSELTMSYEESQQLDKFQSEFQKFKNIIFEIFNEYKNDEINLKNISRLFNKELISYQEISKSLNILKNKNHFYFVQSLSDIDKTLGNLTFAATFCFLIFVIIFSLSLFYLFRDDFKETENTQQYLSKLATGETVILSDSDKKLNSEIYSLIEKISQNYNEINSYISQLISKNYNYVLETDKKQNTIISSLSQLSEQLVESEKELERRKDEDKQKEWSNNGKNMFSEIMRKHSNDLQKLTDETIKNFVKYLDASVGGLFILKDEETDPHLFLFSVFAYDRKKYFTKRVNLGDGLVGTVAVDHSPIYLNEIPTDYLEIESGLGDAPPNNLMIIPLLTDNGLLGVIEIASFRKLEQYEIDFSEDLCRTIAATLESVKINTRTIELLKESQKKSDELAEREKTLQDTMQEVSRAHEIARRNEIEIRGILSGVDQTLMRAEYLPDGSFINSNMVHRRVMGYEIEQMRGKNIMEFIQEQERDNFMRIWNEVVSGRPYNITVKRQNRQTGQDVWLLNQYTPIKDDTGKVIKILYLAIDITEQKIAEEKANQLLKEAKESQLELQGILSGVDNTVLRAEYSPDGIFTNSNKIHQNILGYNIQDMIGKSILDFVQAQEQEEFKKLWREIRGGKTKELTVKRTNKQTGRDIWLLNQYTPIKDDVGNVSKILYLAIDITEQKVAEEKTAQLFKDAKEKEISLQGIQTAIDQTLMRAEYYIDGTFIDANDIHASTLGYEIDKMKGKNVLEFVQEEEKGKFLNIWNSVKRGYLEQVVVKRLNRQTGQEVWLLNQYTPVINENGDVVRILYLAIDITEQKVSEEKANNLLKETREKEIELNGVLTAVDKTLMRAEYTPEGIFVESNNIHQRTMGYDIDSMKGKNILEFIQEDEKEAFLEIWNNVKKGLPQQVTVKRFNKHTGQEIWLLNQYTPIKDEKEEVVRILYFGIDVTEQKLAEQMATDLLIESREKELVYRAVLSGIDQTLMRAEYLPDGTFVDANIKHVTTLGYNIDNMRGKNILEFIPEEEKEAFNEVWNSVNQGNFEQITVMRFNKLTNQEIWLLNQYVPLVNEHGIINKIMYFAVDISEQKKLEQELIVQEQIMNQNMEELFSEFERLQADHQQLLELQEEISSKFDSESDTLYNQWLNSFD